MAKMIVFIFHDSNLLNTDLISTGLSMHQADYVIRGEVDMFPKSLASLVEHLLDRGEYIKNREAKKYFLNV